MPESATAHRSEDGRQNESDKHFSTDNGVNQELAASATKDGDCAKEDISRKQKPLSVYDNAPDGGWGWVVTFSAFMVSVIMDGIAFSFGLFFTELQLHFGASKSDTAWITSVMNGTYMCMGPFTSVLVGLFGGRKVAVFGGFLTATSFFLSTWSPNISVMILLYGILGGGGFGLLYLPAMVSVGHYFKKKRALATGIATCGSGVGAFVFAPLSEFLLEMYTWKGAIWIIAGIALNGIPIALLLRPLKDPNTAKTEALSSKGVTSTIDEHKGNCQPGAALSATEKGCKTERFSWSKIFDFELLKSPTFLLYGCSCFLCMLGFFIPFTFIPDLVQDFGMTSQQGAILISIIGALNTVTRVGVGWMADRPWADALVINSVALVLGGGATMFVPRYNIFSVLAVYSAIFGASIAAFVSLRAVIMAELLGIEKLTSSFGLVTLSQGLSTLIGGPIAGALSDMAGDYNGAFYLAGATLALSGIICIPLRHISQWENRRTDGIHVVDDIVFSSDVQFEVQQTVDTFPQQTRL